MEAPDKSNLARGGRAMLRLDALAVFSEEAGKITRPYLTASHRKAADQVRGWMEQAGLAVTIDALGSVIGRLEGRTPGLPALILASHIDSVRDAGRYDGNLGVILAMQAAEELVENGSSLPFAIEVHAYGDEEGLRFPSTLSSSSAVAGRFDPAWLERAGDDGVTMRDALIGFGGDPGGIAAIARSRGQVAGYFEVHIEQGPQLEAAGLPLGVVTGTNGATRLKVAVTGEAGHSGTVPMALRKDALAAAAAMVLAVEQTGRRLDGLVATVGVIRAEPGAVNVIPGEVFFTIDVRGPKDGQRRLAVTALSDEIESIAGARGVGVSVLKTYEYAACPFSPEVMDSCEAAIAAVGAKPMRLSSGAGHDAMSFGGFCPSGMMFVRCLKGISHNPLESITAEDADLAARALLAFVQDYAKRTEGAARA